MDNLDILREAFEKLGIPFTILEGASFVEITIQADNGECSFEANRDREGIEVGVSQG